MTDESCIAVKAAVLLLGRFNSDVARRAKTFLEQGEFQHYLDLTVPYTGVSDWREFFENYQSVKLLSKFQHFDIGVDRAKVAIEKFIQSEQVCAETNRRVRLFDKELGKTDPCAYWILNLARRKIENVLGTFNWDIAHNFMGFSQGASLDIRRARSDAFYKFGHRSPTVTEDCSMLAACIISQVPSWSSTISTDTSVTGIRASLTIARYNAVTTVPKDAKQDRVIAKEPTMNMFVQRGIGGAIRARLRRVGVDLNTQTKNQEMALKGSRDGSLATIDLSSASDTVALGLVEWLLPSDWVAAIKLCRSPAGLLPDGTVIRYQKVSSMGNGNTFELESLIFWAICSACLEYCGRDGLHNLAVYGDDLIVPVQCADLVIRILSLCGFKTNEEKTFISGPFRESCGKHYFQGRDVTPLYVKERVQTRERKLWLANSLSLLAHRLSICEGWGRDGSVRDSYDFVLSTLPLPDRTPSVPWFITDAGLAGDFDEVTPRYSRTTCTLVAKMRVRVFNTRRIDGPPALSKSMWYIATRPSSPSSAPSLRAVPPGVGGGSQASLTTNRWVWKYVKFPVELWCNLGPWYDAV